MLTKAAEEYSKNFNIMKNYYNLNVLMLSRPEFSASLLQSSVSRDPSEIILICWCAVQETFTIVVPFNIFTVTFDIYICKSKIMH